MRSSPKLIPVLISFPEAAARQDGWGRLVDLSGSGAHLSALLELRRAETVTLSFEVGGEPFHAVSARVTFVEADHDGYSLAELRFTDEVEKRRLARTILETLSR